MIKRVLIICVKKKGLRKNQTNKIVKEMIPWHCMISDDYRVFKEIINDSVKESFELIFYDIPQGRLNSELYRFEALTKSQPWKNSQIRIEHILLSLYESRESDYLLFTDIDILVRPGLHAALKPYMQDGYDMVFSKKHNGALGLNFMLLKTSEVVKEFWSDILKQMHNLEGLDRDFVNESIKTFQGKYTSFDEQLFTTPTTWNQKADYIIMHMDCSQLGKELNMAEKLFNMAQHIVLEPYMQYVNEDIIPYIYEFQELLYKSHQADALK
jgi:hypothetical protein